jgi:DNA-binding transcriptional ArsR family regulator
MDQASALRALNALSHATRLAVFRLLVQRGPAATPAMEVGRLLDLKPSTVSGHLAALRKAGLVSTERAHREVRYAPKLEAVGGLVRFLLQDCCGGDTAACAGLLPHNGEASHKAERRAKG